MQRDVILTAYACSSAVPCGKWAEGFEDEPIVLVVPGGSGASFRSAAIGWARTGDVFKAALLALKPQYKDVEIRNRGLVTFSVGWSFADELLKVRNERNRLDAYLLLDGCHTTSLAHWVSFGERAARSEAMFIMAHTNIKPPFISSKKTNTLIFMGSLPNAPKPVEFPLPGYITEAELPNDGVTITVGAAGNLPKISKTWDKDPLLELEMVGDLTRLEYDGNDRPDHIYMAWHVSQRLWKKLSEDWGLRNEVLARLHSINEPG